MHSSGTNPVELMALL